MNDWPTSDEYKAAIQNPQLCFKDPDLKFATAEINSRNQQLKVWSGNFARVYALKNGNSRWAVKCFSRSSVDVRQRYIAISNRIASTQLSYFANFQFLEEEILINGRRFPIIKMEWVDGQSLDKYIETNLYSPDVLFDLATQLITMVQDLENCGIAHGDLQHGNILIQNDRLKLVDYDGMFVPEYAGTAAPERGLPSYQHPLRDEKLYDLTMDRFPLLVICTSLLALACEPSLWQEFNTGENLLFTKEDFENPHSSPRFQRLRTLSGRQLEYFIDILMDACLRDPKQVPFPQEAVSTSTTKVQPWWLKTQPVASTTTVKNQAWFTQQSAKPVQEELVELEPIAPVEISSLLKSERPLFGISAILALFMTYTAFSGFVSLLSLMIVIIGSYAALFTFYWHRFKNLFARKYELHNEIRVIKESSTKLEDSIKLLEVAKVNIANEHIQQTNKNAIEKNKIPTRQQSENNQIDNDLQSQINNAFRLKQISEQEEKKELEIASKKWQQQYITQMLQQFRISQAQIPGIGESLTSELLAMGIKSAADIEYNRVIRVHGIGSKKASSLVAWRKMQENQLQSRVPCSQEEVNIKSKYIAKRNAIDQNIPIYQSEAKRKKELIRLRYLQEPAKLAQQLTQIHDQFNKQSIVLNQKLAEKRAYLIKEQQRITRLQLELDAYSRVTFGEYLKNIFFISR